MGSVPTSLGEWIHSPWFDLGLVVWKGYRPRVRLVLAGAMLLRGFRLFGVALHREPKGTKQDMVAVALLLAILTGRSDLCIAGVFGAGKTRSLAVLLIALSCELDDFYAVVYTNENVAAKALADQISDLPHQRNQPLDDCWVVSRKERAKRMQRKLMCDAAIATESLLRSVF